MTVQEIFNSEPIKQIEIQILNCYYEVENKRRPEEKEPIVNLLQVRKRLLDGMFVMDDHYKSMLAEFNETLRHNLIDMRQQAIVLYEAVSKSHPKGAFGIEGKCLLGYEYPKLHPVQSMRAKKIWAIMSGVLDDFMPLYDFNGAGDFRIQSMDGQIDSESQMLYLGEELDNWNEGLNREETADMYLIYAFHNLFSHMEFSIFDLLWVRHFVFELKCEIDYHSYPTDDFGDELDWKACDYFD